MKSYTICDNHGTQAVILPEKGATVISLTRDGREYLYRDQANLDSHERPRCGIPFLFPIFGRLKDSRYSWKGQDYSMEIHGFGHTSPWTVTEQRDNALTLVLEDTPDTRRQYPFAFRVQLRFTVEDGTLSVHQTYENRGEEHMPYNYGFHPYFLAENLADARVETSAQTQVDFLAGKALPFGHGSVGIAIPQGAPEAGAAFMGVEGPTILHLKDHSVTLTHGGDFPKLVLWTQAGKPFLCVEPINGDADGLNTGSFFTLAPGQIKTTLLHIRAD